MIKNLKTLAALACFTVAAVASTEASQILQQVNVALNVYSQAAATGNKAQTVVTEKVKISALNTKTIIQALAPGASAKAKLLEYTDYGTSTNITGYAYTVHSVIYTNGVAALTNTPDYTYTAGVTNDSFTFSIDYTNNSVGGITNPTVLLLVTNTSTNGYSITTNYAGGLVLISNTVTAASAVFPSGVVLLDNGYEIDDNGSLTVLTNTVLFPANGVTNVGNSNTYKAFSIAPVSAATSEINGSEKAVAGTPLGDADSGKSYDVNTVTINAPGTWAIRLQAFNTGAISTLNIGGNNPNKNPAVYIDYTNSTLTALGYGFMGGTATTFTNGAQTNSYVAGSTPVLLKGTISETLYKFTK